MNIINTDEYKASTCIRITHKAFQLEEYLVEFSIANVYPTKETIAASGKEKFGQMKDWPKRPFRKYQCNKYSSHFVISQKHKKVNCTAA